MCASAGGSSLASPSANSARAPARSAAFLTEGEQRLIFNGTANTKPDYKPIGPVHTFVRAEARSVRPGAVTSLSFALNPISVLLPVGHRIRVAIAGADAGTFERLPADGAAPVYDVQRSRLNSSYIDLPEMPEARRRRSP
jgi:hypothetical protein